MAKIADLMKKLTFDTKAFHDHIQGQLESLEKLKGVGETLKEITGNDDEMQPVIKQVIDAISGIEDVARAIENIKLPDL